MSFIWNFENLLAEVQALDAADPYVHLEIAALIRAINISRDDKTVSLGEAYSLMVMLFGFQPA